MSLLISNEVFLFLIQVFVFSFRICRCYPDAFFAVFLALPQKNFSEFKFPLKVYSFHPRAKKFYFCLTCPYSCWFIYEGRHYLFWHDFPLVSLNGY